MLGLHEHSLSYGPVAVGRGTASLNIISQRVNGFRVNSRAKGLTNAARQAIRIQSLQGGQPGSINGVGSHEIGSGFNSRRRSHPRFNSLGIRSHVSRAILPLYSKPRGSRSRHFSLTHELFFTVENRSRFLSTIILNTKSYIVLLDTGLKSPECCIGL